LNEATFSSAVPAEDSTLRVSEINYNPPPPSAAETDAGFSDNDDFEFIELANVSDQIIDLTEVRLEQVNVDGGLEGVSFDFSKGTVRDLNPGEVVLVVEDLEAFEFRYGAELPVTGQWQGKLGNGGETITLMSNDAVMQQFAYSDEWFPETDGAGRSLESVEPAASDLQRWAEAAGWFASNEVGGSPGGVGTSAVPGDSNHDGVFSSSDLVLVFMAGEYEDNIQSNSTFETGDWDGDGEFTTSDLVFVFAAGSYVAVERMGH
jgi:hypothetical protein